MRRAHFHRIQVGPLLVGEQLLLQLDLLLREAGIHALQRGELALIVVAELGAREVRQNLSLDDAIAGVDHVLDGAGGGGEHRGAHGRDHCAAGGDILNEAAAGDGRELQAP